MLVPGFILLLIVSGILFLFYLNHRLRDTLRKRNQELSRRNEELQWEIEAHRQVEQALRESEERYAAAAHAGRMAVWEYGIESEELHGVEPLLRFMGYSPSEFSKNSDELMRIAPEEDYELIKDKLERYINGEIPAFEAEHRATGKDGSIFWFQISGSMVYDEEGKPVKIAGTSTDITERKLNIEALRREQDFTSHVMEASPVALVVLNTEGRFTFANTLAVELLQLQRKELSGITYHPPEWGFEDLEGRPIPDEDLPFRRVMAEKKSIWDIRQVLIHADGTKLTLSINARPLLDEHDNITGMVAAFQDITEQVRIENERREFEASVQQAQKLESLGVLAGGIAHDFNNLLMGIVGNVDLVLLKMTPDPEIEKRLEEVQVTAHRAADLCRQMLAYAGKGPFQVEPVNLSLLVEDMTRLMEISITKKATLQYRLKKDIPVIRADITQLRQVIMNLVTNASEAIGNYSGVITLETDFRECDQEFFSGLMTKEPLAPGTYVSLSVSDTGCGMNAGIRERLFEPFFTTKFTGRGLGMAAVLGIIEVHNGAIEVVSAPGEGSRFTIWFPAEKSDIRIQKPLTSENGISWHGSGKLLLVDDEEVVLQTTSDMLRHLGFEVITASNGREAVEFFQENCGKLKGVLLDLTMPEMDGRETFTRFININPGIPVIISSGYMKEDFSSLFSDPAPAAFMEKPYKIHTLSSVLKTVLDAG